MHRLALLLYSILIVQLGTSQIDPELSIQLQTELNNSVENNGNHGVSAYLIMPDGKTWSGTSGIGKSNVAITDTTLFNGASTTKMNIAILILLMAEEDLIDLDASWPEYLSLDLDFDTSITVRQLLNHTSGIKDYLETANSGNDIMADFNRFYTPQEILEDIVDPTPDFTVGTGFQYSNSNYVLAALIAESVTENSLSTELRNRIWLPLGMHHTYFGGYEEYTESIAGIWWNFGNGVIDYSDLPTTSIHSYAYGAGNIVTCPSDLAILLSSLINGQLLTDSSLNEMKMFVPNSFGSWTAGYGLGIHHSNQLNDQVLGHDGYYTNLTDMFHSSSCEFTLVTMTNTQTSWFGIFNPMYSIVTDYCESIDVSDVTDIDSKLNLQICPNPTSGNIDISSNVLFNEIELRDLTGKLIDKITSRTKKISLTLEDAGTFLITIKSHQNIETQKIVVF